MEQKTANTPVPARLRVFLSRDSPQALILRRGPSKQVLSIGWDRSNDQFTVGQWLKGVIYTCDISPDGAHWLYGASDGRRSWTALARLPWLKAVDFYQHSAGACGGGGGLFLSNQEYWLQTGPDPFTQISKTSNFKTCEGQDTLQRILDSHPHHEQFTYPEPVQFFQNGWVYLDEEPDKKVERRRGFGKTRNDCWQLQIRFRCQNARGPRLDSKGISYDHYSLYHRKTGETLEMEWDWADISEKRLLWAEKGKIFSGEITEKGLGEAKELFDTNPLAFIECIAPY